MYTYTLRKELSVELEWGGRGQWGGGQVSRGQKEEKSLRNQMSPATSICRQITGVALMVRRKKEGRGGGGGGGRGMGRGRAGRSPLLGGLGGPGWGDRPARVHTAVLVLGLLF